MTETATPTPLYTPTITLTPTKTIPPTATLNPLQANKEAGIYLVGVDIAPGIWRNNGNNPKCYWQRSTKTGEIIDNFYGMAGGTIYIAPTDYQVELHEECGTWVFLQEP